MKIQTHEQARELLADLYDFYAKEKRGFFFCVDNNGIPFSGRVDEVENSTPGIVMAISLAVEADRDLYQGLIDDIRAMYSSEREQKLKFEEFQENVHGWSTRCGIYAHSTASAQLMKGVSEMGEICDAEIKDDDLGKLDGVGDLLVCIINYCALANIDIGLAMDYAWNQIKDRKGYMSASGAFVKEEPNVSR